ncbi:MAG TPA: YigZ family protein [Nocardioidaceae bacterium]|nr:YigZ family protein [Nocardioidaceae bacterium]
MNHLEVPRRYRTVAGSATAEIEVKRSRFIAAVARAETETEARALVERARKEHWDARHHCSAFVLGPRSEITRSSDDGEPAGTAGAPMLEVVKGAGLSDVSVVVTRYFGGVLLGAGGLVRAYGDAVRAGLELAGVRERQLLELWDLTVDHADAARLENDLRARGVAVRSVDYAEQATLHLATDGDLPAVVRELTAGSVAPTRAGEVWVDALH